jgi:hypothetical protein
MAEYIENCLQLGVIVDALNYVIDEFQLVDPTKIMYNNWYSTPDFILSSLLNEIFATVPNKISQNEKIIPKFELLSLKSKD